MIELQKYSSLNREIAFFPKNIGKLIFLLVPVWGFQIISHERQAISQTSMFRLQLPMTYDVRKSLSFPYLARIYLTLSEVIFPEKFLNYLP